MALDLVPTGKDVPNEVNVIIEIPKDSEPVKYEVDKASGAIFVDRVLTTPMRYPPITATYRTRFLATVTPPMFWW